jgi:RimJ/RimL family protein N-acetyltransferase
MQYAVYKGAVKLIRLKEKHFPLFYRWWNDAKIRRLTADSTKKLSKKRIDKYLRKHLVGKNIFDFIIVVKKKLIGHVLVQYKKRKKHFELYIAIGEKNYWGRGIGAVAVRQTVRWFFRRFPREKALYLEVLATNTHAIECYDFVGFKRVRMIPRSKTVLMKFSK